MASPKDKQAAGEPTKARRKRKVYQAPEVEVVDLAAEESLLGTCMIEFMCEQPFSSS